MFDNKLDYNIEASGDETISYINVNASYSANNEITEVWNYDQSSGIVYNFYTVVPGAAVSLFIYLFICLFVYFVYLLVWYGVTV